MEINKKTRNRLRIQGISLFILVLAIAGLIFQLTREYNAEFDWTSSGRHTISEASIKVLNKLDSDLNITSYASSGELSNIRHDINDIIKRYEKESDKIKLKFVDPRLDPQKTKDLGISMDGEMILEYQGRTEHLKDLSEKSITNAIYRLIRNNERQILFVTGHGERNPLGQANFDVSIFVDNLNNKGFKVAPLDLGKTLSVPSNASVLVIASPQVDYLPGEVKVIKDYVANGGNLLWTIEPGKTGFLKELADYLNVNANAGLIVDLDIGLLGNDPTLVLGQYIQHPITNQFSNIRTLFPQVAGIEIGKKDGWEVKPFVQSMPRSWLETGKIEGTIKYDPKTDKPGPIPFAYALTRKLGKKDKERQQRLIIMGDGDFLSNTYLGLQGNLNMGESIINWLSNDDNFIDIPATVTTNSKIDVSRSDFIILGSIFELLIPVLLIGAGIFIWLRRRKR
ncbi:MAG: Gldg family protein [Thioalkalispiraceae bacterium]|jgi:ABC-type uncharacterized transport system involved in gliding motility auxiliary subunit